MKKCPFCAEEIQDAAIKCRYCHEFLDPSRIPQPAKPAVKWYFRTTTIILVFLCVGPLVLPLILLNPHYNKWVKIVLTIIVLIASYYMILGSIASYRVLMDLYRDLQQYQAY